MMPAILKYGLGAAAAVCALAGAASAEPENTVRIDCASDLGAVNPFVWGVGAPDKYRWWPGDAALIAKIRAAGIKLVRVNPVQLMLCTGRDPYPSPGAWRLDDMDRVLNTIFDAGAQPLFVVAGFPKGVAHGIDAAGHIANADWSGYARFMRGVVERYNVRHALGPGRAVRYWEMWNEPPIEGDGKFASQADYGAFVETVGAAMKAADPAIRLAGPAAPWSDLGANGWVAYAAKNLADRIDILSWHDYGPGPGHTDADMLAWPEQHYEANVNAVRTGGARGVLAGPGGRTLGAAITEYNISWQDGGAEYDRKYHSRLNAVYDASAIVHALRGGAALFCAYNLAETGANHLGLLRNSDYAAYEPYYVYALFGRHFGDRMLAFAGSAPFVDCAVSEDRATGRVFVVLVNRDPGAARDVTLRLDHLRLRGPIARAWSVGESGLASKDLGAVDAENGVRCHLDPYGIVSVEVGSAPHPSPLPHRGEGVSGAGLRRQEPFSPEREKVAEVTRPDEGNQETPWRQSVISRRPAASVPASYRTSSTTTGRSRPRPGRRSSSPCRR